MVSTCLRIGHEELRKVALVMDHAVETMGEFESASVRSQRKSLSRLWVVQIRIHFPLTFSKPLKRNCRKPLPCLI